MLSLVKLQTAFVKMVIAWLDIEDQIMKMIAQFIIEFDMILDQLFCLSLVIKLKSRCVVISLQQFCISNRHIEFLNRLCKTPNFLAMLRIRREHILIATADTEIRIPVSFNFLVRVMKPSPVIDLYRELWDLIC